MSMAQNEVEYKVEVFISSKCGGRYTDIRNTLKEKLESTGMVKAYVYEISGSSSQNNKSAFLIRLKKSDLCIFLIDNKDGISDGVLHEHQTARENELKSLYLFCNENEKKHTHVQDELRSKGILKDNDVSRFKDLANQAYKDTINEIADIYISYCRKLLTETEKLEGDQIIKFEDINLFTIDKNMCYGFVKTKCQVEKAINIKSAFTEETSLIDEIISDLYNAIMGNNSSSIIDFKKLIEEICKKHKNFMHKFLNYRLEALKAYFDNNLDECLTKIKLAYGEAETIKKITNWLLNDVLIDMRNIENKIALINNKIYNPSSKGQKGIDENVEYVYFPLLDRFDKNAYSNALYTSVKDKTVSPYSTTFGGWNVSFENITNAFIIGIMFGSLTHTVFESKKRLTSILSSFCFIYREHNIYVELIKMLILTHNDKEINKIIRAYNQTTEMIDENDIENILKAISHQPSSILMNKSFIMLIKYYGYHFSDEQFEEVIKNLLSEFENWIDNDERAITEFQNIFDAFTYNRERIDGNKVAKLIVKIYRKKLKRFYDNIFDVLVNLNYNSLKSEIKKDIVKMVVNVISNSDTIQNIVNYKQKIIRIRKFIPEYKDEIDSCVKLYMARFYDEDYSLELAEKNREDLLSHINRYLEMIATREKELNENSSYKLYNDNPYEVIKNIIKNSEIKLISKEQKIIVDSIKSTLLQKRNSYSTKIFAMQLLTFLSNKYNNDYEDIYNLLLNNRENVEAGLEEHFFKEANSYINSTNLFLCSLPYVNTDLGDVLIALGNIYKQDNYKKIQILKALENLFDNLDFNKISIVILHAIAQFTISMSLDDDVTIRHYSIKVLTYFLSYKLEESILKQLSIVFNNNSYQTKLVILQAIKKHEIEGSLVTHLKQKAKVDNHYLVRKTIFNNFQ